MSVAVCRLGSQADQPAGKLVVRSCPSVRTTAQASPLTLGHHLPKGPCQKPITTQGRDTTAIGHKDNRSQGHKWRVCTVMHRDQADKINTNNRRSWRSTPHKTILGGEGAVVGR
jgi:hypothetical protein